MLDRWVATATALTFAGLLACGPALGDTSAERMRAAARDLLAAVSAEQRKEMTFPFDDEARYRWSNLPRIMREPDGVFLSELGAGGRTAVHGLLRASLSASGYAKVAGIVRLDDLLRDSMASRVARPPVSDDEKRLAYLASGYDSGNFAVAVYGDPDSDLWGWQIDGHHVGANFTVVGDDLAFTPLFLGSNPMRVETGPYSGWMPLPNEGRSGYELAASLTPDQRSRAIVGDEAPGEIIEGPGNRGALGQFEGIPAGDLSAVQMRLLKTLVREYLGNGVDDASQLTDLDAGDWESLHFAWRGPVEATAVFYYRVHGPRILIEYNRQGPNHEHTVLRDAVNDFGADWLDADVTESHPSLEAVNRAFSRNAGVTE